MGMYNDPEYFDKESHKMRRVLSHIGAFFAAIVVYMVAFTIVYFILSFLGAIPILRTLLFYPGDVFWTRICLSPLIAVIAAAVISETISGSARPVMLFGAIIYIAMIPLMIFANSFSGETLVQDIVTAAVCVWQFRVSPTLKDAKIAMMNKTRTK